MVQSSTPEIAPDRQLIQGYGSGSFTVSGVRHRGSLLVFPDHVLSWSVATPAELDLASLAPVRDAVPRPEILIVGSGAGFALFPPDLRQAVREWGIVVEIMTTPAACRTYNVLLADERRVAAALIAMPAA
ncbi:Mth938-like domain-containing protein [Benzoatithermus flavus]|uniref:Mth938-like domain-containing protein n=1 Tax=Benzoatithermus flavus TaxID=3108223 RepID=A0ABU8XVZ6_9PROT